MGLLNFLDCDLKITVANPIVDSGETIKGQVILHVKKQFHSKGVKLYLIERIRQMEASMHSGNNMTTTNTNRDTVKAELQLAPEQDFTPKEYTFDFSMKTPLILKRAPSNIPGIKGKLVGIAETLVNQQVTRSFYIKAKVDIPGGLDKTSTSSITINPKIEENQTKNDNENSTQ